MPSTENQTNSWLCIYAIAQIGKPYWYKCSGDISSRNLYNSTVKPALQAKKFDLYTDWEKQLSKKVHDAAGLVIGALTCDKVDVAPTGQSPVMHSATDLYYACSSKNDSMATFPKLPGTLVFTTAKDKTKSTVGIYVGTYKDLEDTEQIDIVVEAYNHASGVITTKVTNPKWDSWGQLNCCKIDTVLGMVFDAKTNTYSIGDTVDPQSLIESRNMKPFVATIFENTNPKLDYGLIKSSRVSAMMFFAGELYDNSHNKKTYINPYLDGQVNQCSSAGLPYALYANVKAKTIIEADAECRALYYVVAQYPPTMGLWLSIKTSNTTGINDDILELYYKYITKWGLAARCGLYITPTQLSKITWGKFQERFYLWLIDPMNIEDVDDELLQPEMFEVPDE